MSDESLLAIVENKPDDYTADALAFVEEAIASRGGVVALKQRVRQSHPESSESHSHELHPARLAAPPNEIVARLKRFYLMIVFAAYDLFMLAMGGSLWFYWLCVFAMIASFIRVLIRARRLTVEEEYEEIAREMAKHPESATDDQPFNE